MMSPMPVPDETAELAGRLRLAVTRLARQLRQTSDSDLSPTQSAVLATLANHGPVTLGELAELERVASPTITKVTGILQERGLVVKVTDRDDRRFVRVELTYEGHDLVERSRARKTAWLARQLQDLTPEEVEQLRAATEVLERLTARKAAR
jgi:DNA-binding MarR family transcriptional regulator